MEKIIENRSGVREGSGKGNENADEKLVSLHAFFNYVGVDLVELVLCFAGPEKGWERRDSVGEARKGSWHGREQDLPRMAFLSLNCIVLSEGATLRFTLPLKFVFAFQYGGFDMR